MSSLLLDANGAYKPVTTTPPRIIVAHLVSGEEVLCTFENDQYHTFRRFAVTPEGRIAVGPFWQHRDDFRCDAVWIDKYAMIWEEANDRLQKVYARATSNIELATFVPNMRG